MVNSIIQWYKINPPILWFIYTSKEELIVGLSFCITKSVISVTLLITVGGSLIMILISNIC